MAAMAAPSSPGIAGRWVRQRFPFPGLFFLLAVTIPLIAREISCAADSPPKSIHLNLKVKLIHHHIENWRVRARRRLWQGSFDELLGPPQSMALPSDFGDDESMGFPQSFTPPESAAESTGGFPGGGGGEGDIDVGGGSAPPRSSGDGGSSNSLLSSTSPDLAAEAESSAFPGEGGGIGEGGGGGGGGQAFAGDLILRSFLKSGFAVDVSVGTPARTRSLSVEYDSYITWTFCGPGTESELPRSTPNDLFLPEMSTTAVNASCSSSGCLPILTTDRGNCSEAGCSFELRAGSSTERSVIKGHLVSDLMMLQNVSTSLVRYGALGCVTFLNGSFVNSTSDGVLALGPAEGTFMAALREQLMIPDVLSFCFNASGYYKTLGHPLPPLESTTAVFTDGGSVVLGTPPEGIIYPTPLPRTPVNKTRLAADFPFAQYVSRLVSWSLQSLRLPPFDFDATSPLYPDGKLVYFSSVFATYLPSVEHSVIAAALTNATKVRSTMVPVDIPDLLVFMDSDWSCDVSIFPVINFTFVGGLVLSVNPEDYVAYVRSEEGCLVVLPFAALAAPSNYYELGTSVLQSKWLTFDFSGGIGMDDEPGVLKIGTGPCSQNPPAV